MNGLRPWFEDLGFPLPEAIDISTGYPSGGRRSRQISESWSGDDSDSFVIYVRPDSEDEVAVAAAIAFQLCRISVDGKDEHGHLFRHLAISIGLKGRASEAPAGTLFKEMIQPILDSAGKMPRTDATRTKGTQPREQTTRMIKVTCPKCGYLARVSREWINDVGPPLCPKHGPMKVG